MTVSTLHNFNEILLDVYWFPGHTKVDLFCHMILYVISISTHQLNTLPTHQIHSSHVFTPKRKEVYSTLLLGDLWSRGCRCALCHKPTPAWRGHSGERQQSAKFWICRDKVHKEVSANRIEAWPVATFTASVSTAWQFAYFPLKTKKPRTNVFRLWLVTRRVEFYRCVSLALLSQPSRKTMRRKCGMFIG